MAAKKKTTKKKATKKSGGVAVDDGPPPDPREVIEPTAKNLSQTLDELKAVVAKLDVPEEPVAGDLVNSLVHILVADGYPCGMGQEIRRRFELEFVDRNEFRIAEAFETAELLSDLGLPDPFDRCRAVQMSLQDVYSDQNKVDLEELREATASERKNFFQRVPGIPPFAAHFLNQVLNFEEIVFSPRSTQRVQQRVGLEPKDKHVVEFVDEVRAMFAPFGHLPLDIGPHGKGGKPVLEPVLSPMCLLVRLGPAGKR